MNAKIKWIEHQKMLGESGTGHSEVMDALDSGKGVSPMEMLLLGGWRLYLPRCSEHPQKIPAGCRGSRGTSGS